MKTSTLISSLCVIAGSATASIVTFETPTYPAVNSPIGAIDGWTASEPNYSDVDGDFPLFYTQMGGNGSTFGTIGGKFFAPDTPPYSAQRDYAVISTLGASSFGFQFSLTDSFDDTDQMFDGTGIRNDFSVTITTGGTDLIHIDLFSEGQGGPTGSENWAAWYTIGGGVATPTGFAVTPGALTKMTVDFTASGLTFSLGADDGSGPQPLFVGNPVGYSAASTGDITAEISFLEGEGSDFSNNSISLDNIGTIPEPSSLMLLGLSALGFVRRRR